MDRISIKKNIARKLREARQKRKLSQESVAQILHLSNSTISKLENGTRELSLTEAAEFAKLYRRSIKFFLSK